MFFVQKKQDVPSNVNSGFRRSASLLNKNMPLEALRILRQLQEVFPENKKVTSKIKELKRSANQQPKVAPEKITLDQLRKLVVVGEHKSVAELGGQLLDVFPKNADLLNTVGSANAALGYYQKAEKLFVKSINSWPLYANARNNLGVTHVQLHRVHAAINCFFDAITVDTEFVDAWCNYMSALRTVGRAETAQKSADRVLELEPDNKKAVRTVIELMMGKSDVSGAVQGVERAELGGSNLVEDLLLASNVYGAAGKAEEEFLAAKKAMQLDPTNTSTHYRLSKCEKTLLLEDLSSFLAQAKAVLSDAEPELKNRYNVLHAIANYSHLLGERDEEFQYLCEANASRKSDLQYDISTDLDIFERLKEHGPPLLRVDVKDQFEALPFTPIFIVGMPRSGTSLLEQILGMHSKVQPGGELTHLSDFGMQIMAGLYMDPESLKEISREQALLRFRQLYIDGIREWHDGSPYVTDKLPLNLRIVPLLRAAFPEAKIIYIVRDEMAVCWSNFITNFKSDNLGYACDLDDCMDYIGLAEELMKRWCSLQGIRAYTLQYENLTREQRCVTAALTTWLGLDWEESCMAPHTSRRIVATASKKQVKAPVYQGSSAKWRAYEPQLRDFLVRRNFTTGEDLSGLKPSSLKNQT